MSFYGFITQSLLTSACFGTFGVSIFNFVAYFVWQRINDEGSVPEMRIWSILLIKSDLKWCILLSRSFCLYVFSKLCAACITTKSDLLLSQSGGTKLFIMERPPPPPPHHTQTKRHFLDIKTSVRWGH